jgi:hypothetical protein
VVMRDNLDRPKREIIIEGNTKRYVERATVEPSRQEPSDPSIHPLIFKAAEWYLRTVEVAQRVDWVIVVSVLVTLVVAVCALITLLKYIHATHAV